MEKAWSCSQSKTWLNLGKRTGLVSEPTCPLQMALWVGPFAIRKPMTWPLLVHLACVQLSSHSRSSVWTSSKAVLIIIPERGLYFVRSCLLPMRVHRKAPETHDSACTLNPNCTSIFAWDETGIFLKERLQVEPEAPLPRTTQNSSSAADCN